MRSCFRGVCLGEPWVGIPDKEKEQDKLPFSYSAACPFLPHYSPTHGRFLLELELLISDAETLHFFRNFSN